jgi:endonuclease/exonuclease/phosphatase family metal-dependent hydrolase
MDVRILTYNVHSCRGLDGRLMPERIAEVIASTGAEVVCLQELDVRRERTGRIHQAEVIAQALAMKYHFFPAISVETEEYGDAILSRHEIKVVKTGALPRPRLTLEPRGALWVEIFDGATTWQVINTHLGLGRNERRVQASELAGWIKDAMERRPMIFCGDLNSRSGSRVHRMLGPGLQEAQFATRGAQRRTFSTSFRWVCLDYIYASSDVKFMESQVIDTPLAQIASDHFPLMADVTVETLSPGVRNFGTAGVPAHSEESR